MVRKGLFVLSAVAVWVAACPKSFAQTEAGKSLPPVILISVDTLRADHLSCYGYKRLQTPNIDALAQGGTLFTQVSTQVPLTTPAHASLFTSTYPFVNGLEDNAQQLAPNTVTLARTVKSRGYQTAAFLGGFVLDRRFGLDQGFDLYDSPFNLTRFQGVDPGDIKRLGEDVIAAAEAWIKQSQSRPIFLFLHLYDLHTPYNLPQEFRARFGNTYTGEVAYADSLVGRFVNSLKTAGLFENSLIVFLSDHGESLGEHGESTHGYFIYQSTAWVPLIIHWPAEFSGQSARFDHPVSLIDVAPTILQAIGVARPAEFQGRGLLGGAVAKSDGPGREVYCESLYARRHLGASALRSLRAGQYKFIEAPKPELYDLAKDPSETENLFGSRRALALSLRDRLSSLRSRYRPPQTAATQALSPEAVAALSSLGYVGVSAANSEKSSGGRDPKDLLADYEAYGRALSLAASGRMSDSNAALRGLLAKDSGLVAVQLSLGLNLQKQGQHREAAEIFRAALKQDPLNVLAHFNLAVSYLELRSFDDAAREAKATLVLAPYYTRAEELLGGIALQRRDFAVARSHFTKILSIAPDDYSAHYNLGTIAFVEEKWDEAERHLRAAAEVDPRSAEVHNTLGSYYLRRRNLTGAKEEFQKAISLRDRFAWAYYNLGLVLREQGESTAAKQAFRQALAADPGLTAARTALERMDTKKEDMQPR